MSIYVKGIDEIQVKLETAAPRIFDQIAIEMEAITIGLQATVVTEKLEGQVLKSHTHHLARSITQSVSRAATSVTGTVGVAREAPYGAVHEMGGTYQIPEHTRTSKLGKSYIVRAHEATFPTRSFLRTTLREQEPSIIQRLQEAANRATV